MDSDSINLILKKLEKPKPWIKPKTVAIKYLHPCPLMGVLHLLAYLKLVKLVNRMVIGIKNSTQSVLTLTRSNPAKISVSECPTVNAVAKSNTLLTSLYS